MSVLANGRSLKMKSHRQLGILIVLVVMAVIFAIGSNRFLTFNNIISILQQTAIKGVLAVGMTMIIILGGIDLSIGSTVALSSMVAAMLMVSHGPSFIPWAIAVALLIGVICGFANGALISIFNLQPFLVTMGTASLVRGIDYIISGGMSVRGLPKEFINGMNFTNGSIPIPVIILIAVSVIVFLLIKYSKYGRYIYAVGGNEEATRLSGVHVKRVKIITYTLGGVIAAICGIIYLGRLAAADVNAGQGYELNAIAAAAIGGASLAGGKGSISGTLMGAFMLAMLANGLTLLNIQAFYQEAATGLIIIIAVLIDKFSN